jgi:F-type H+-transporting ATPase subunit gamma
MASIISLKRRIKAAQNVSKATRAMQMIAASKFKKAQNATLAGRPYVQKLISLNQKLMLKVDNKNLHPYMNPPALNGKSLLLVLSPDKGSCGPLVTNLLREFMDYQKNTKDVSFMVVGKKMEGRVTHLSSQVIATFNFGTILPTFDIVYPVRRLIDEYYLSKKVDSVKVLFTNFNGIFTQKPEIKTLLPIEIPQNDEKKENTEYIFEPNAVELLPELLGHYLEMSLFQYFLESFASEQASRMIAMKNATENANDIIDTLKLEYNKVRQAKITSEILDITGGAISNG